MACPRRAPAAVSLAAAPWHSAAVGLAHADHRQDPGGWARALGVSREAVELYLGSDVVDLHVDSFIWSRLLGYDLTKRHGAGPARGRFLFHVDLPRIREARITGAVWSITTNPLRPSGKRATVLADNLAHLRRIFARCPEDVVVVRTRAEYESATRAGRHAAFIGIQGGNALDRDLDALAVVPDDMIVRITLVHLSTSAIGTTSSPLARLGKTSGLTAFGRDYVRRLNARRIFVDLAHIDRRGFFDAVEVHDRTQPLMISHTGVTGVHPHWRNVDDAQLRAVADTGGVVGVMYERSFLAPDSDCTGAAVVDHLAHIARVAGEDTPALGSDWDGMITPPRDLRTCVELPRLVQHMLDRRFSVEAIRKVLGGNFLRALGQLRP
jgi:membrane dipeptidase